MSKKKRIKKHKFGLTAKRKKRLKKPFLIIGALVAFVFVSRVVLAYQNQQKKIELLEETVNSFEKPETAVMPSPTPNPSSTPSLSPTFIPLPLVSVPKDDLQTRKNEFAQKVKNYTEKSKAAGVSNTAMANTIRLMYQIEFGTNADSQQNYSNCLIEHNTKLSEYNACMLGGGGYGCYKPVNTCRKSLGAGF